MFDGWCDVWSVCAGEGKFRGSTGVGDGEMKTPLSAG